MFICKSQLTQHTFTGDARLKSNFGFLKLFACVFTIFGLWRFYRVGSLRKLASAYVKCIKIFFGYHKYCSVSNMLMGLGLPSFNTVIFNANLICDTRLKSSVNSLIQTPILV